MYGDKRFRIWDIRWTFIKLVGYVIHKTFRQKREVTGETVIKTFSGSKCLKAELPHHKVSSGNKL